MSRVDDKKMKKGKKLIFPGLSSSLRAPGNQPEVERERETDREGHGDPSLWWSQGALLNSIRVYTQ